MWYKKRVDLFGKYQDAEGTRYSISECHRVVAPDGRKNNELGYEEFENLDECVSAWSLTKIVAASPRLNEFRHFFSSKLNKK